MTYWIHMMSIAYAISTCNGRVHSPRISIEIIFWSYRGGQVPISITKLNVINPPIQRNCGNVQTYIQYFLLTIIGGNFPKDAILIHHLTFIMV